MSVVFDLKTVSETASAQKTHEEQQPPKPPKKRSLGRFLWGVMAIVFLAVSIIGIVFMVALPSQAAAIESAGLSKEKWTTIILGIVGFLSLLILLAVIFVPKQTKGEKQGRIRF